MKIKTLLCLAAVLLLLVACGKKAEDASATVPTEEALMEATTETAETEASVPAVEDSIFDDETLPDTTEEATTEPTETTQPTEATEATEPQETTAPTEPAPTTQEPVKTDYEAFQDMTSEEQQTVMNSFSSMDAFFDWYYNAKAEYEAANPPIDVGDGEIDFGDIAGDSN